MTNDYVIRLKKLAINKWRRLGYSDELIEMAIRMADEWIYRLALYYSGGDEKIMNAIIRARYGDALRHAEKWLEEISK